MIPFNSDAVRSAARWLTGARPPTGHIDAAPFAQLNASSAMAGVDAGDQQTRSFNYRAIAGFSAFGVMVAGLSLPVYAATHQDDDFAEVSVLEEEFVVSEELEGAAALAAAPSLVGAADPVEASLVALGNSDDLRSYENLVIAIDRDDYTKMVRRGKVIEELLRRLEANSLEPSGVKISEGVEQMVDYAINAAIKGQGLPPDVAPDTATVLQNALTLQTIRLEGMVSKAAAVVAEWPEIDQEEADRVLLAEAAAAQAEAEYLRQYKDSVDGFENGELPAEALCPIDGYESHLLRCDAAAQLNRLNRAFRAQFGKDLGITDTYRSLEEQIELKKEKPVLAGKPGTSNHGWGRAIDVSANVHYDYDTPEHLWMIENAPKFGWHNPKWAAEGGQKEEAWHWEFNGVYEPLSDIDPEAEELAVVESENEDPWSVEPTEDVPDAADDGSSSDDESSESEDADATD